MFSFSFENKLAVSEIKQWFDRELQLRRSETPATSSHRRWTSLSPVCYSSWSSWPSAPRRWSSARRYQLRCGSQTHMTGMRADKRRINSLMSDEGSTCSQTHLKTHVATTGFIWIFSISLQCLAEDICRCSKFISVHFVVTVGALVHDKNNTICCTVLQSQLKLYANYHCSLFQSITISQVKCCTENCTV